MIADNVIITGSLKFPEYSADPRGIGVWSIGGNIITARRDGATAGTQNAALHMGGYTGSIGVGSNTNISCTEEYNGTSWSAGGALNTARSCAASGGTQNDAFFAGGVSSTATRGTLTSVTEEYDGISWIVGGTLIGGNRCTFAGAGNTNAGIVFGGQGTGFVSGSGTEEYDGTTWTAGGLLSKPISNQASAGTQNATLSINGRSGGLLIFNVEEYNGTTWSAGGNTSFSRAGLTGGGTQNNASVNGGADNFFLRNNTEIYDGTIWRTGPNTNKYFGSNQAGAGSSASDAIVVGNTYPNFRPYIMATEEYSNTPNIVCVPSSSLGSLWIDTSKYDLTLLTQPIVWSYGPSMITTNRLGSAGTSDSSFIAINTGGYRTPGFIADTCTEEFDGITWATGGSLGISRFCHRVVGTQNAALSIGGLTTGSVLLNSAFAVSEYDGTTWISSGALITNRYSQGATGTQNAAVIANGITPTFYVTGSLGVEEYNGTTWSSANGMITNRWGSLAAGTQNAAIFANGATPAAATSPFCVGETTAQTYDGTNWSTIASTNIRKANGSALGTQNAARTTAAAVSITGGTPLNEIYDGYTWSMTNPNAVGGLLRGQTGGGSASSGLLIGSSQLTELLIPPSVYNTPIIASSASIVTRDLTHLFNASTYTTFGTSSWTNLAGPNNLSWSSSINITNDQIVGFPLPKASFNLNGTDNFLSGSGFLTGSAPKSHTLNLIGSFAALPATSSRYKFFTGTGGSPSYGVIQNQTNQGIGTIRISQGSSSFDLDVYQAPSNGQFVSQSQKAMFTFISKDTGIDFYLNGNLLGSTTGTFVDSSYTNPTSTYWWGSDENGTNPLSMSIFHIMWYSASLTEAEVVQNYNAFRFLYNI